MQPSNTILQICKWRKYFGRSLVPRLLYDRDTPFLHREGIRDGRFRFFAEKGRGLHPQRPSISCTPVYKLERQ